jgi:hypothetical protein
MCSMIVYFMHCICVCDCDGRHELLIMLSHSVMVRRSHLLARCYLGTMCMCMTAFLAVDMYMDMKRQPNVKSYWSKRTLFSIVQLFQIS